MLKKKKFNDNQQEVSAEVQQARAIHLAMRSSNMNIDFNEPSASDFSVPDEPVHSSNVPAAVSVDQSLRKPIIPAVATTKVVATLTDVTSALQHVFDQNKGSMIVQSDNSAVMAMLEGISGDVKLILSELVKLNEYNRQRDFDLEEGKAAKQPRHH